ncbi:hypothetical protein IMZ48_49295, partial [Candidatus Bathyarchaeota archaeon]|nr:hypothetical protein [Candidatus Bathyarchaeota archaeon]
MTPRRKQGIRQLANAGTTRNGRWRSLYTFDPSSNTLEGSIKIDVHYYEDGNVRLLTDRSYT